jgi:death on curing protein
MTRPSQLTLALVPEHSYGLPESRPATTAGWCRLSWPWDDYTRATLPEPRYLTVDEIIEINKNVLREIRVKRADAHRVASRQKIEDVLRDVQEEEGDVYLKAAVLLIRLTKAHAFDSGNRRTAYASTKLFLEANGKTLNIEVEPKVLTGIREGFYQTKEVVEWLKGHGIRPFVRP